MQGMILQGIFVLLISLIGPLLPPKDTLESHKKYRIMDILLAWFGGIVGGILLVIGIAEQIVHG